MPDPKHHTKDRFPRNYSLIPAPDGLLCNEHVSIALLYNIRDTQEKLLAEQQAANSLARYQLRVLERIACRLAKRVKLK